MAYYGRYSRELRRLVRVEIDGPVAASTIDPGAVFKPDIPEPALEPFEETSQNLVLEPLEQTSQSFHENRRGPLGMRALNLNKNNKDRAEAVHEPVSKPQRLTG